MRTNEESPSRTLSVLGCVAASVIAVLLSSLLLPHIGIDSQSWGVPAPFAYLGQMDRGRVYPLVFLLDVLAFLVPMAVVLFVCERVAARVGADRTLVSAVLWGISGVGCLALLVLSAYFLLAVEVRSGSDYLTFLDRMPMEDVTLLFEIRGDCRVHSTFPFRRHVKKGGPYQLRLLANVDRGDYQLVVHSAKLNSASVKDLSAIPENQKAVVPLGEGLGPSESCLGPNTFHFIYTSPIQIPLREGVDDRVTVDFDLELRKGTEAFRRTFHLDIRADVYDLEWRQWSFSWGLRSK